MGGETRDNMMETASLVNSASSVVVDTTAARLVTGTHCLKFNTGTNGAKAIIPLSPGNIDFAPAAHIIVFSGWIGLSGTPTGNVQIVGIDIQNEIGVIGIWVNTSRQLVVGIASSTDTIEYTSFDLISTSGMTYFKVVYDFLTPSGGATGVANVAYVSCEVNNHWQFDGLAALRSGEAIFDTSSINGFRWGGWYGASSNAGADWFGDDLAVTIMTVSGYSTVLLPSLTQFPIRKLVGGASLPPTAKGTDQAFATNTATGTGTSGTATGATTGPPGTLTHTGAGWTVNQWAGATVVAGGKSMLIASNTATVLTGTAGWSGGGNPGAVGYVIYGQWEQIDDFANDGSTSYVGSAVNSVRSGFKYTAANPVTSGDTIHATQQRLVQKITGAKAGAVPYQRDGSGNYQTFQVPTPTTTHQGGGGISNVAPVGGGTPYDDSDFDLSGGASVMDFGVQTFPSPFTVLVEVSSLPGPEIIYSNTPGELTGMFTGH